MTTCFGIHFKKNVCTKFVKIVEKIANFTDSSLKIQIICQNWLEPV